MLDQIGIAPFVRAWTPRRFEYAQEPKPIRDAKNIQGFRYLNVLALTCAVGIAVFVHPVLRILSHPAYLGAANIVLIILGAYIVQGWVAVVELGIDLSEKTRYANYGVWASVATVLALYALLIPPFGGYGAAWATLLAFLVRLAFHWHFSQKLWPIAYGWKPVLQITACALVVAAISVYFRPASIAAEIGLGIGLLGVFVAAVWTMALHDEDRRAIAAFVSARTRAIATRVAVA